MEQPDIISVLWRPPGVIVRDGGFRRAYAILERLPSRCSLTVIDRYPSPLSSGPNRRVIQYKVPKLITWLQSRNYLVSRALEVFVVAVKLFILICREIRRRPGSVFYLPTTELWWTSLPTYAVRCVTGSPLVMVPTNTVGRGVLADLNWHAHRRADVVIAISEAIKEDLSKRKIRRNVHVNGIGFEPPDILRPSVDGRYPNVTYVGRVEKGLADHLLAWRLVVDRISDAKLTVVGHSNPKTYRQWERRRTQLELGDSVRLAGVVPEDEKWRMLGLSRVFLFLSRIEGWGIAPLEALWAGLPVVLYDLPCYSESLADLKGVYRVPVGDYRGAAAAVIHVLTMPEPEFRAVSASIRNAFRSPSWRQVADREFALMQRRAIPAPQERPA